MSGTELSFEQIRDQCFVNPRNRDPGVLPAALHQLAENLLGDANYVDPTLMRANGLLNDYLAELTTDMHGARRFDHLSTAQLHPADNIPSILGHVASTLMNNNTIIGEVSPVETRYERESVEWLLTDIAGYSPDTGSGSLVGGGTSANQTAMYVAREKLIANRGWDGEKPAIILASEMAHYSIHKAAGVLAPFGLIEVVDVPFQGDSMVMDPDQLAKAVAHYQQKEQHIMAVVGLAGETETGLVEDLDKIADIAKSAGIYFHVDGAYGAPFKLSREGGRLAALKEADSITCDPHKFLYTPYPSGAVLFKDAKDHEHIQKLNEDGRDYMFKDGEMRGEHDFKPEAQSHLGAKRIEGSMGGQAAASLQALRRVIGNAGIGKILDHTLDLADVFQDRISASGCLRPLFDRHLNSLCVIPNMGADCYPKELQQMVEDTCGVIERNAGIYVASTAMPIAHADGTREKRKVFRIVPTHPHTSIDDVEHITESLVREWEKQTR